MNKLRNLHIIKAITNGKFSVIKIILIVYILYCRFLVSQHFSTRSQHFMPRALRILFIRRIGYVQKKRYCCVGGDKIS